MPIGQSVLSSQPLSSCLMPGVGQMVSWSLIKSSHVGSAHSPSSAMPNLQSVLNSQPVLPVFVVAGFGQMASLSTRVLHVGSGRASMHVPLAVSMPCSQSRSLQPPSMSRVVPGGQMSCFRESSRFFHVRSMYPGMHSPSLPRMLQPFIFRTQPESLTFVPFEQMVSFNASVKDPHAGGDLHSPSLLSIPCVHSLNLHPSVVRSVPFGQTFFFRESSRSFHVSSDLQVPFKR